MDFIQMFAGGGLLDNKINELALIRELGSTAATNQKAVKVEKMPRLIENQGERYIRTWKLKESVDNCGLVVSQ
jgi:hypothetical protein